MAVNTYIYFNGNCREAVEFYSLVFETEKPRILAFGDTPQNPEFPLPEEAKNLVLHTELKICGTTVMFSDTFPGSPFVVGNNIGLTVVSSNIDEIKTWFNRLKEGGTVTMGLQQTFWSECYGSITDKFGIQWQLSLEH